MTITRCASPRYPRRTPVPRRPSPPTAVEPAVAEAAHELRNALAGIASGAECMRRRLTDECCLRYVEDIIRAVRQGANALALIEEAARRPSPHTPTLS
jgi:hypothetical protein